MQLRSRRRRGGAATAQAGDQVVQRGKHILIRTGLDTETVAAGGCTTDSHTGAEIKRRRIGIGRTLRRQRDCRAGGIGAQVRPRPRRQAGQHGDVVDVVDNIVSRDTAADIEQILMLQLSDDDIIAGNLISHDQLEKDDLKWLKEM